MGFWTTRRGRAVRVLTQGIALGALVALLRVDLHRLHPTRGAVLRGEPMVDEARSVEKMMKQELDARVDAEVKEIIERREREAEEANAAMEESSRRREVHVDDDPPVEISPPPPSPPPPVPSPPPPAPSPPPPRQRRGSFQMRPPRASRDGMKSKRQTRTPRRAKIPTSRRRRRSWNHSRFERSRGVEQMRSPWMTQDRTGANRSELIDRCGVPRARWISSFRATLKSGLRTAMDARRFAKCCDEWHKIEKY